MIDIVILVFIGGAVGAMVREFIMLMVPPLADGFPMDILVANVVASFLLGLVTALYNGKIHSSDVNTHVGTGVMGGMSTFSSFAYGSAVLMQQPPASAMVAVAYVVVSIVVGYAAVLCGLKLGEFWVPSLLRHPSLPRVVESGLITIESRHSVADTIERFAERAQSQGMQVFSRVDHAGGAHQVGLELRPTELIIFGNPRSGTPLMQDHQAVGVDLPSKALIWEDASGKVWLTLNDPGWLAERHHLTTSSGDAVKALTEGSTALAKYAAGA